MPPLPAGAAWEGRPLQAVEAVILAGGKGTRLASRLGGRPKPLVEIAGEPLLSRQLKHCRAAGVRRVMILVNHLADQVEDYCRAHDNFGLDLQLVDDGEPRGTAGAVLAAFGNFRADEILVLYGDTLLNVDLERFFNFHGQGRAEASLFLHPNNHPQDSDLVETDDEGRITAIHPYPRPQGLEPPNLVNAALYFVRRRALEPWLHLAAGRPEIIDFAKQLFPLMLQSGGLLRGYVSPEYIKDVGSPERLDQAEADLASGRFAAGSLAKKQCAVFLDRDGTINEEVGHLSSPDQLRLLPGAAGAIRRFNAGGLLSVVVSNQPVVARGDCDEAGLRKIFNRMEALLGLEQAYVDRIYYCPHHPDKGFAGERPELKMVCDCRKPAAGMLLKAAADMNIDLASSWLVGDRSTDLACAARAGLSSILVATGAAGLDQAWAAAPDFRAADLALAADFIFNVYPDLVKRAAGLIASIEAGRLVAIGGPAHSGKSALAALLARELRIRKGLKVHRICLDGFLKPLAERGGGVLERYDLPAIAAMLEKLQTRRGNLELPFYVRHRRQAIARALTIGLDPECVLIVEGVPALLVRELNAAADIRIGVSAPRGTRRRRFGEEYRQREEGEAWERLFEEREAEETPLIEGGLAAPGIVRWSGGERGERP